MWWSAPTHDKTSAVPAVTCAPMKVVSMTTVRPSSLTTASVASVWWVMIAFTDKTISQCLLYCHVFYEQWCEVVIVWKIKQPALSSVSLKII